MAAAVAAAPAESYHRRVTRVLLFALALVVHTGCAAHYVNRGADLYAGGRYIEAAEVFERTETRLASSSPPERCRYGLYRGATLLALGDGPRAENWLHYSSQILQTEPDALSEEEHTMLTHALRVSASQRGAAPALPPHDGTTVATSRPIAPNAGESPSN
jgi:hypothetical protein